MHKILGLTLLGLGLFSFVAFAASRKHNHANRKYSGRSRSRGGSRYPPRAAGEKSEKK